MSVRASHILLGVVSLSFAAQDHRDRFWTRIYLVFCPFSKPHRRLRYDTLHQAEFAGGKDQIKKLMVSGGIPSCTYENYGTDVMYSLSNGGCRNG